MHARLRFMPACKTCLPDWGPPERIRNLDLGTCQISSTQHLSHQSVPFADLAFGCTGIMAYAYAYILYMHYAMSFFGFVPYVPLSARWLVSHCLFQCFKVINAPIGCLAADASSFLVLFRLARPISDGCYASFLSFSKSPIALSRLHKSCCHGSFTRFSLTCMCILARL